MLQSWCTYVMICFAYYRELAFKLVECLKGFFQVLNSVLRKKVIMGMMCSVMTNYQNPSFLCTPLFLVCYFVFISPSYHFFYFLSIYLPSQLSLFFLFPSLSLFHFNLLLFSLFFILFLSLFSFYLLFSLYYFNIFFFFLLLFISFFVVSFLPSKLVHLHFFFLSCCHFPFYFIHLSVYFHFFHHYQFYCSEYFIHFSNT